ncbi:MAG: DNA polymerase III subunit [Candidatus Binatia bacterium]
MSEPRSRPPGQPDGLTTLSSILGQDAVVAMLRQALARGTLPHAILFAGPEGVGKRTTALALAAERMCTAGLDEACGRCVGCFQVAAGTHPDLRREGLGLDERGERRERTLIEQVRAVQAFLGGQALGGRGKIAIFEEAQALTEEAQNALLKTLEEPPRGSLVVLVSHNASRLLPTVRSRCQRVAFAPLRSETLLALLRDGLGLGAEDAEFLSRYSDGSLAFAADPASLREAHERATRILEAARSGSYPEIVCALRESLTTSRGVPLEMKALLGIVRHRMRASAGLVGQPELTPRGETENLISALHAAEAAYAAVVDFGRNANRSLAAERMALRIGLRVD